MLRYSYGCCKPSELRVGGIQQPVSCRSSRARRSKSDYHCRRWCCKVLGCWRGALEFGSSLAYAMAMVALRERTEFHTEPLVLVVVLGGVTSAELAAIRYLQQAGDRRRFLVLTTGMINGTTLIESIIK